MKKNIQNIIAAFALLVICNANTNAQVTGSYVPTVQQSQTQWCWAACGEMIYWAYKPGTIAQCTFVRKSVDREQAWWGIGGCNNLSHSSLNVCSYPGTFNQPQSIYGCNGSLSDVLNEYGVASTSYASSLSAATLTTNTSGKKHMVARWGWNGGGGHAIVINRYKAGYVYFNNPGNNSANIWTYNTFKTANGSGNWTHTIRMNSAAVYGSTYYRIAQPETATETLANEVSINTYPNPATEKVNILINAEKNTEINLMVMDMVGKVVFAQQYPKETTSVALDVTTWNRGMYIVSINNNSKLTTKLSLR